MRRSKSKSRKRALKASALLFCAASAACAFAQSDPGAQAYALEQQGRVVEAESAWEAIALQNPQRPEPLAHLGLLESKQEHYPQAIAYYKRALLLNPAMQGLRLNLGLAYFKSGDYAKSIETLSPLLKAQPGDQRLTILIGMSHYGLGQYAAASPFLKNAADHDPQNLNLLLTLAHSCLLSTQYPCVVDAYHKIIAQNAESAEADMLVGEALDEMKDALGAIREFRAAIAVNPKEPDVHFGLGYLLWTKAQYPEAASEFQEELNNDPTHLRAKLYLADARIQLNQPDEARPLLEDVVKRAPENAMAHRDLGIALADLGQQQAALPEFQAAIKANPKDVNAHWRLGRLYRAMGESVEAKAEFDKASSLNKAADEHLLRVMSTVPAGGKSSPSSNTTPNPNK